MVTTGNCKTSSSPATLGHLLSHSVCPCSVGTQSSVVAIAKFPSMPSSSRHPCFIGAPLVHYRPPLMHFVSSANSTRYFNIVCHHPLLIGEDFDLSSFGSIFVDFLTRQNLLRLVQGLSLPNFQIVSNFYANFYTEPTASNLHSDIVVSVRGVFIPVNFVFIAVSLGLALIWPGATCEPVPNSIPCLQLMNLLYVSPPEVLPTKLSSGMMSQWTRTLYMLVCNFLNLTSQHGKVSWKAAYLFF